MIRVSTTTLESFRRVLQSEWGNEGELIRSIQGNPDPPSWQMEAGSAWASIMERYADMSPEDALEYADCSTKWPYAFSSAAISQARAHIGAGIPEVKASAIIGGAQVVAQVDSVWGLEIQEHKAKFSDPDPKQYEPALQWRFYLAVQECASVRYNLFHFKDPKPTSPEDVGGYCELKNIVSFKFWSYHGLMAECEKWVRLFTDWADSKGLIGHLEEHYRRREAA